MVLKILATIGDNETLKAAIKIKTTLLVCGSANYNFKWIMPNKRHNHALMSHKKEDIKNTQLGM